MLLRTVGIRPTSEHVYYPPFSVFPMVVEAVWREDWPRYCAGIEALFRHRVGDSMYQHDLVDRRMYKLDITRLYVGGHVLAALLQQNPRLLGDRPAILPCHPDFAKCSIYSEEADEEDLDYPFNEAFRPLVVEPDGSRYPLDEELIDHDMIGAGVVSYAEEGEHDVDYGTERPRWRLR